MHATAAPSPAADAESPVNTDTPEPPRGPFVELLCDEGVDPPRWGADFADEGIEVVERPLGLPPPGGLPDPPPHARLLYLGRPLARHLDTLRAWSEADPVRPLLVAAPGLRHLDHVLALEMGADDIVDVSTPATVVTARLRAMWRRAVVARTPEAVDVVRYGGLEIQRSRRRVRLNEQPVELSEAEFDLLWRLVTHPGQPMSRAELRSDTPDTIAGDADRRVASLVYRLRVKLGDTALDGQRLRTVRRYGYAFTTAGW